MFNFPFLFGLLELACEILYKRFLIAKNYKHGSGANL